MDEIAAGYLVRDAFSAAETVPDRIIQATERLRDFPYSGRVVENWGRPSLRQIFVQGYRIIYEVFEDVVEIQMVVLTTRQFPPDEITRRERFGYLDPREHERDDDQDRGG